MRVAVIDLGSNAARMTIADIDGKVITPVKHYRENVRLSENMSATKMLQPQPVSRTLKALKDFKLAVELYNVEKTVAVATAAMRNAKNKEVITTPLAEMGIHLEIIDGLKEAYYDYVGVINSTDAQNCVIIDIGGASTELILVKGRENIDLVSLPFGAVTVTENYIMSCDAAMSAEEYVKFMLGTVDFLDAAKGFDIVAIGGTARSFGQVDLGLTEVPSGHKITTKRIKEIIGEINLMSVDEIREHLPVESKRADIIHAGFAILGGLIDKIDAQNVLVSRSGVREGILYDLAVTVKP